MKLLHLITDYGTGDPAFGEVIQKLTVLNPDFVVYPTSVSSFNTIATGFWTAQYALVNPAPGMVIFTNTAPRKDNKESRDRNEGEKLMYAKLDNGIQVVGVNAGYCFSFIKDHIKEFHYANVANKGSQFRSRDFYPEAAAGVALGKAEVIGEKADPSIIPAYPKNFVAWIDGYGNMKTTTRLSDMKAFTSGQPITVSLNGMKRTAYFTNGTFAVREGELAFAPGSSGWDADPFMELFLRGLSAWKEFGKPEGEIQFTIEA